MGNNCNDSPEKYWNFTQLQNVPRYVEDTEPESAHPGLRAIVYDGVTENGETSKVFAYIALPEGPVPPGGFPGIVLVHGGGGTAFPWATKLWCSYGYAVITPDWYGRRPCSQDHGHQQVGGIDDRKYLQGERPHNADTTAQHITNAANMVLAHSLLRSLPQVNPEKTAYVGLSWGSWYGAMVTAIDPRFKGVVEIYLGDRTCNDNFINGRFLHAAKVPMYYIVGTNDQNGTPETMQAGFEACGNMLAGKTMIVDLPHSHEGFRFEACRRIADAILQGGVPLPELGRSRQENGMVSVPVLSVGNGIKKAFLCYTTEREKTVTHERKWEMVPAEYADDTIKAELPPDVFQYFLAAYDDEDLEHYCCGSSDLVTIP